MTTQLEDELQADVYNDLIAEGVLIDVTFRDYEALSSDVDESEVTTGSATERVGKCIPPEAYREALGTAIGGISGGGVVSEGETQRALLRLYLLTGVGTSSAISWAPTKAMEVVLGANTYRIVRIDIIQPGDEVLMYGLILER